jgi:hypothetical protein
MTTNRENLLLELGLLDDWNFLSVLQNALLERNARNRSDFSPPEGEALFPFLRFVPAQYLIASCVPGEDAGEKKSTFHDSSLKALAMHSYEQVDKYLEVADEPDSRLSAKIVNESSFHQEGSCEECGLELWAAGKRAFCPVCGTDVYLT